MTIPKIKTKLSNVILIAILVTSFGFSIYCYIENKTRTYSNELAANSTEQPDHTNLVAFLTLPSSQVQGYGTIEIFDIGKEQVIKKVSSNDAIQKEVKSYLKGITGMYVKIRPIPEKGYMVKIPLEPPIKVENSWLNSLVDQMILVLPEHEVPYLLVFDNENRAVFYTFKGTVKGLLKQLDFQATPTP